MKILRATRIPALVLPALALFLLASVGMAQDQIKTIHATAHGQGNQAGMTIGLTVTIDSYSPGEDRNAVWQAFAKDGDQGLTKAIIAMPARGHLSFTGVAEYEIAYVRLVPAGQGRKMRIVARRPLAFGETRRYENADYLLAAVDFDLSKGTGAFVPACELSITAENEIEILTYTSAWQLGEISTATN
jgi:hypothetical protein